jgi:thymidine kinase
MADLVFYYGAMGCSKTANALMTRFQYIDKGLKVWLIKPSVDNRSGSYTVGSRVGIQAEADAIIENEDNIYTKWFNEARDVKLIVCDEAQFLTEDQVDQLKYIAENNNITVYCYGLRTDFRTKLFPGSKRLFEICSKTVELESICECGKPAIINARFNKDGKIMMHGAQVDIGGDEKYKALCYSCWKELSKEDE